MSDEILDIAHGDARLAQALRQTLASIAEQGSDQMREMARDVLDGASLRQVATSSAYGDEVGEAIGEFWTKYQEMTPGERAELEGVGRTHFTAPE
ncbi:hypothetical protein [Actinoplanes aureus]|uniref:Uncharacterized protein n=1 Tax=Actinoplanes aureus TaxID=2792083 RepID=A0A931CKN1_9ACTN|nr:hypothetical protein [Actinoplanes aureus]MBG0568166.1 hypothetical protein [Actinoplanes aureus]